MRVIKTLLSIAAVAAVSWAVINGPVSSYKASLGAINSVVPGAAAKIDPENSLHLQRDQLDGKVGQAEASLVELKTASQDINQKRRATAANVKYNEMLLAEGRALFAKAKGEAVEWIGVAYTPGELHTQLSSLFNEMRVQKEALADDAALASTIEENIANMAAIRSQLVAARDRLTGQIALYRVNKLVGDFHTILDESRVALRSYDEAASTSEAVVKTVRTGSELRNDRDHINNANGKVADPEFESWLAETVPPLEALSAK